MPRTISKNGPVPANGLFLSFLLVNKDEKKILFFHLTLWKEKKGFVFFINCMRSFVYLSATWKKTFLFIRYTKRFVVSACAVGNDKTPQTCNYWKWIRDFTYAAYCWMCWKGNGIGYTKNLWFKTRILSVAHKLLRRETLFRSVCTGIWRQSSLTSRDVGS